MDGVALGVCRSAVRLECRVVRRGLALVARDGVFPRGAIRSSSWDDLSFLYGAFEPALLWFR